jgi:hypothetical protein
MPKRSEEKQRDQCLEKHAAKGKAEGNTCQAITWSSS